jgi:hypothetical protein
MGVLSELVVTISGQDSPLRQTLKNVHESLRGMKDSGGEAGSGISAGMGGAMGGLAPQIGVAMRQAMGPMNAMMAQFMAQFDRVGGTIVTMARRVDANMKFPAFEARLIALEAKIASPFLRGSVKAIRYLAKVSGFLNNMGDVAKRGMGRLGMGGPAAGSAAGYGKIAANISGIAPAARAADKAVGALHGGLLRTVGAASLMGALGIGFAKAVKGASNLNESLNKVDVIFGPAAARIKQDAQEMANKFGIVKTEFMDMEGNFGQLLQSMGKMTQTASAAMSGDLARMAADASSLFNVGFEEAGTKIAAALRGETEPIRSLGVDVSELTVEQELLRSGAKKVGGEFTTQQKVVARSALVTKGLRVAMGDLAATSGGFANINRAVWGRVQNAMDSFGQAILPVVEKFYGGMSGMLTSLQTWVDASGPMFASWAATAEETFHWFEWAAGEVVAAASGLAVNLAAEFGFTGTAAEALGGTWQWLKRQAGEVFEGIGIIWRNWSLIGEYVGLVVTEKMINIGEAFTWLIGAAATVGNYLATNWVALIKDAAGAAWSILANLAVNIKNLFIAAWEAIQGKGFHFEFTPLLKGFEAAAAKLPDIAKPSFTKLSAEFAENARKMGQVETDRITKNAADAKAAAAPQPAAAEAKRPGALGPEKDAPKSKKAETTDLAGYFKNLQEGVLGKGNDAAKTAKYTERTATGIDKLLAKRPELPAGYAVP